MAVKRGNPLQGSLSRILNNPDNPTRLSKEEAAFEKDRQKRLKRSGMPAIQRARKANAQPPAYKDF